MKKEMKRAPMATVATIAQGPACSFLAFQKAGYLTGAAN